MERQSSKQDVEARVFFFMRTCEKGPEAMSEYLLAWETFAVYFSGRFHLEHTHTDESKDII